MAGVYFQKKDETSTIPPLVVRGTDAASFKRTASTIYNYDTEKLPTVKSSASHLNVDISASRRSLEEVRTKLGQTAGSEGNPFVLTRKRKAGVKTGVGSAFTATAPFEVDPTRGSGLEGIHGRPSFTNRDTTTKKVIDLALKRGYVLIKAPPQSGKTALLQLIRFSARNDGRKCALINCADEGRDLDIDEIFKRRCGGTLQELIEWNDEVLILIDEAQVLYNVERTKSEDFWLQLKRLQRAASPLIPNRVHVILAAAYGARHGSALSLSDERSPITVPVSWDHADMVVSVSAATDGGASLALEENDDFEELWKRFVNNTGMQLLDDAVRQHIFTECAGQVGLITQCLDFLERDVLNEMKDAAEPINASIMYKLTSRELLAVLSNVRSLARFWTLQEDPNAVYIMNELLWEGELNISTLCDPLKLEAVTRLCQAGQTVLLDWTDKLYFTSPLHRAYYMSTLYRGIRGRSDWNMLELLSAVISTMNPSDLSKSFNFSRSERHFHMEVCRAMWQFLPPETALSPNVGQRLGANGILGFYISSPSCKAIEVTRDGKAMEPRLGGFLDRQKYFQLLACGALKEHAVVDFRSPGPSQQAPQRHDDDLYTVLFSDGFKDAEVWHNGNKLCTLRLYGGAEDAAHSTLCSY